MPEPFAITDAAKQMIVATTEKYAATVGKPAIAAICWIDAGLNKGKIQSQPAVAFYVDRAEIEDDITVISGLEIVLAVSDEDRARFLGRTLDFVHDRFVLKC
jgi:hypothetical protein